MDDSWAELKRQVTDLEGNNRRDKPLLTRSASKKEIVNPTRAAKVTVVEAVKQGKIDIKSRLATTGIAARRLEMAMNQKTKRTEAQFANRGIDVSELKSSSGSNLSGTSSSSNMTNGSTVPSSEASTTTSDARRKQLNKWKQEKNAMQNITDKKPTFKPGGVTSLNNKPQKLPPPPIVRQKAEENKRVIQQPPAPLRQKPPPPPAKKPVMKSNNGGVQTQLPERRVTRAMTKGGKEVEPTTGKTATNKPILQEMKALNINGNNRAAVKPSSKTLTGPPAMTKNKLPATNNRTKTTIIPSAPVESKSKPLSVKPNEQIKMDVDVDPPDCKMILDQQKDVDKKVPKKPKPQAIDAVYTEYNLKFSQALHQLSNYYERWTKINEDQSIEIPTEIRDDIISTLGKVRLLLSSKLPQFVELLYSYLCKDVTPSILECDLQGWWDVAYIQVSLVFSQFEKLAELEANKWVRQEIVKKKTSAPTSNGMKGITTNKIQGTASKGMKEFLAMKRKGKVAQNGTESPSITSGETSMDSSSSQNEKKFEGGFFVIQSPARSTTTTSADSRRASLRRNENSPMTPSIRPTHTPGGRRLSTSLSLRSLTLRNSMGPLYKLGAVPADDVVSHANNASDTCSEEKDGAGTPLKRYYEGRGLPVPNINIIQEL